MNWLDTVLVQTTTKMVVPLPPLISVPRKVQNSLYAILRDKYHLSLILRTGPTQREIELQPTKAKRKFPADIHDLGYIPKYKPPRPPLPKRRRFSSHRSSTHMSFADIFANNSGCSQQSIPDLYPSLPNQPNPDTDCPPVTQADNPPPKPPRLQKQTSVHYTMHDKVPDSSTQMEELD